MRGLDEGKGEVTHPQQCCKFSLKQLFQFCLIQAVLVTFLAGIFAEGLDEEADGNLEIRHDGAGLGGKEIKT